MNLNLNLKRLITTATSVTLLLLVAACGGGSGAGAGISGDSPADSSPKASGFSGTAAVGAPLVGSVTVKDAIGTTRGPTPIGGNGAYQVDVTGMTPPFVFRAQGEANGQKYIVHSVATAADANGTINITQLTDLVVANVARQTASSYFEQFEEKNASADKTTIDAQVKALTDKLTLILQALGVDAAVDLLRTPFTPLKDALDRALDAIRVSIDDTTNTATISTLVNSSRISYDLATGPAAAAPLSADNIASGASDMDLVKKAVTDFGAKFATGLPNPGDLTPLLATGFLNDDVNGITFANQVSEESLWVGGAFTDITIHGIDYSNTTNGASTPTARISFTILAKGGIELGRLPDWRVRRDTDGIWRLHGNRRALNLEGFVSTTKIQYASYECRSTGLNFNIENTNTSNDGGSIAYILVTGPGLPAGGVRYDAPLLGGRWQIKGTNPGRSNYIMASSCSNGTPDQPVSDATIAAIPAKAVYTLTGYASDGVKVIFPTGTSNSNTSGTYAITIERGPLTLAELAASTGFPSITAPTTTDFSSYVAGELKVTASNVTPSKSVWVRLMQNTVSGDSGRDTEKTALPKTDGSISTTFSFPALTGGDTIASRRLSVESPDAYRRNFFSAYQF